MAFSNAFRVSSLTLFSKLKNPGNGIRPSSVVSNFITPSSFSHSFNTISSEMNNHDDISSDDGRLIMVAPYGRVGLGSTRGPGWEIRESREAVLLKFDMPGFGKEDVQIIIENNTFSFEGEAAKEFGNDDEKIRTGGKIDIPTGDCDMDSIVSEVKYGVLKVLFPKAKPDGKNIRHITVD